MLAFPPWLANDTEMRYSTMFASKSPLTQAQPEVFYSTYAKRSFHHTSFVYGTAHVNKASSIFS